MGKDGTVTCVDESNGDLYIETSSHEQPSTSSHQESSQDPGTNVDTGHRVIQVQGREQEDIDVFQGTDNCAYCKDDEDNREDSSKKQ